ncbi:MAG: hypothetical protein AAGJ56_09525 [Myxococcota bacterium]
MAKAKKTVPSSFSKREAPRSVAFLSGLQAVLFLAAAWVLPWRFDLFSAATMLLGGIHGVASLALLMRHRRALTLWRAQGYAGLGYVAYVLWIVGRSASYLSANHGGLGTGLAAASLAALAAALFFVLPTSVWALAATGGWSKRLGRGALAGGLILGGGFVHSAVQALPHRLDRELAELARVLEEAPLRSGAPRSLYASAPIPCAQSVVNAGATVFVHFVGRDARAKSHCLQQPNPAALKDDLRALLEREQPRPPIRLDHVTAYRALGGEPDLVRPFVLNPGRDGACFGRGCVLPWQLVARGSFDRFEPLDFIQDLHFGADPKDIRSLLDAPEDPGWKGLIRIETEGLLIDRNGDPAPSESDSGPKALVAAASAAEGFIIRSQRRNGTFTYRLDPTTGRRPAGRFSLARQSGTLFALCERPLDRLESRLTVERAMAMLAGRAVKTPSGLVLRSKTQSPPNRLRLGPQALALSALLTCRARLEVKDHDAVISALGQTLLAMQRPDTDEAPGRFATHFDPEDGPTLDRYALYADGQGVLALVLMKEALKGESAVLRWDASKVQRALESAMTFYSEDYFRHPMRRFFFLEENWHCIAAARSLSVHRHDSYERFCLDYLRFKERLILDADDGVNTRFVGGYGFGNVVVPYMTPTAGFGEAAAAGLAIARARNEPAAELEHALASSLDYLVAHQLRSESCFTCAPRARVDGAFSESPVSPGIRIDYVQHAMAALTHGAAALYGSSHDAAAVLRGSPHAVD